MSDLVATEANTEDRSSAYKEAAVELGKGIALGLVPFLGQAIDVYDTVESAAALYNAKKTDDKENAQFDLLLAIIGWIPGPGDGVKKSLRIVNKNPERFAPVLFDLLRFVLQECGIHTSPEALLDEMFNASKLRTEMDAIIQGVKQSSVYEAMPAAAQTILLSTLQSAQAGLPAMVGIVEKRLKKWKKHQPNSSANRAEAGRARDKQPGAQDAGTQGRDRAAHGAANESVREQAATLALPKLTNELLGISGEHIADYMCAYNTEFAWGKDWTGHDAGTAGKWANGNPSSQKLGKLSKGGNPKEQHILYKLSDGANGTGIDAVWRANPKTNHGKKYAIVEAKASRDEDAPKFHRKIGDAKKPGVAGTLGVVIKGELPIKELVEVIEPIEEETTTKTSTRSSSRKGSQKGAKNKGVITPSKEPTHERKVTEVYVQMSHQWIIQNLDKAVAALVAGDIRRKGYSRHLFYAPKYHTSNSPAAHFDAKLNGSAPDSHAKHDAFHYDENKVKLAVNKRKTALRKKHGNLASLKEEK